MTIAQYGAPPREKKPPASDGATSKWENRNSAANNISPPAPQDRAAMTRILRWVPYRNEVGTMRGFLDAELPSGLMRAGRRILQ